VSTWVLSCVYECMYVYCIYIRVCVCVCIYIYIHTYTYVYIYMIIRVLRSLPVPVLSSRKSEAAFLMGSSVRIPLRTWMFVCCVCCVGFCDRMITRSEESYGACVSICVYVFFSPCRSSLYWARVSLLSRRHDHTQTHMSVELLWTSDQPSAVWCRSARDEATCALYGL
jgi:hypothetical protein